MLSKVLLPLLGVLINLGEAAPAVTSFGYVEHQQKPGNASGLTNIIPSGAIYSPSWPMWVNETTRWSTFSAPTFDLVFIPKNENEISKAVSSDVFSLKP
jgi:hypothetical protein